MLVIISAYVCVSPLVYARGTETTTKKPIKTRAEKVEDVQKAEHILQRECMMHGWNDGMMDGRIIYCEYVLGLVRRGARQE